jgi:hypothetical protein
VTNVASEAKQVAYFTDEVAQLVESIDDLLLSWMLHSGARKAITPPLISTRDLDRIQYFDNFPHQANVVSTLRTDKGPIDSKKLHGEKLRPADLVIPTAACYGIYVQHADSIIVKPTLYTTRVACARAEDTYEPFRRLRAYYVREYVYLGTADGAKAFVDSAVSWLYRLIAAADLRATIEPATDSFFERESPKAVLQRLSRAKQELVYRGGLAVSSVNYHRNYFGESFGIRLPDHQSVYTACFGAGLERWVSMFLDRCGGRATRAEELLRSLRTELARRA